jgi:hypothetical protein
VELTITLNEKDYWQFSKFFTHKPKKSLGQRNLSRLFSLLTWVLFGVFIAYMYKEVLKREGSIIEILWPMLIVAITFLAIAYFYTLKFRKNLTPKPGGFILGTTKFKFTENGIEEEGENYKTSMSWGGVLNILNELNYIYIVLDTAAAYIIPKRIFNSEDQAIEFFNQLEKLRNNYS